jgi:hypothetical protein
VRHVRDELTIRITELQQAELDAESRGQHEVRAVLLH